MAKKSKKVHAEIKQILLIDILRAETKELCHVFPLL